MLTEDREHIRVLDVGFSTYASFQATVYGKKVHFGYDCCPLDDCFTVESLSLTVCSAFMRLEAMYSLHRARKILLRDASSLGLIKVNQNLPHHDTVFQPCFLNKFGHRHGPILACEPFKPGENLRSAKRLSRALQLVAGQSPLPASTLHPKHACMQRDIVVKGVIVTPSTCSLPLLVGEPGSRRASCPHGVLYYGDFGWTQRRIENTIPTHVSVTTIECFGLFRIGLRERASN